MFNWLMRIDPNWGKQCPSTKSGGRQ